MKSDQIKGKVMNNYNGFGDHTIHAQIFWDSSEDLSEKVIFSIETWRNYPGVCGVGRRVALWVGVGVEVGIEKRLFSLFFRNK